MPQGRLVTVAYELMLAVTDQVVLDIWTRSRAHLRYSYK